MGSWAKAKPVNKKENSRVEMYFITNDFGI